MENFQSTIEGEWVKVNSIVLTSSEKALLASTNEEDTAAKKELVQEIKSKKHTTLTETESSLFVILYNKVKPVLKKTDAYELIACNVYKSNKLSGLLNCRVNGEHLQVRF